MPARSRTEVVMFPCSSCGAPIQADAVLEGVAQCASCGLVVDAPKPPPTSNRVVLGSAPDSVFVRAYPQGVHLVLPWRKQVALTLWPVMLVLTGAPLAVAFLYANTMLESVAAFAVGVSFGYNFLCLALNNTHVLIGRGGVEVTHGPLPTWHRLKRIDARDARRVAVERALNAPLIPSAAINRGRRPVFHLVAIFPQTRLLDSWLDESTVQFVADTIEALHPPP